MNQHHPIQNIELPLCPICNLQPTPQSKQHVMFYIFQTIFLIVDFKLMFITLAIGYSFAQNQWYCPQCNRQIEVKQEPEGADDNIIIRIGNCIGLLSRSKFRVIASILVVYLIYLLFTDFSALKVKQIAPSWDALANCCGYQASIENSYQANSEYNEYMRIDQWKLQGILLSKANTSPNLLKLFVKMNPTQFKNQITEDLVIITKDKKQNLEKGDLIQFLGKWEGREQHMFRFVAKNVTKIGVGNFSNIKLLKAAQKFIRIHEEEKLKQ